MEDDEEDIEEIEKEESEREPEPPALFLSKLHSVIQRQRVRCVVRCAHLKRNGKEDKFTVEVGSKFQTLEKYIAKEIQKSIEGKKVWENWGKHVKGLGAFSMGKLLGFIDIEKDTTVSKLWRYAGFNPGEKREAGEKLHFNMKLKSLCWRIAGNLLKAKGKYYLYYLQQKTTYQKRFGDEGKNIIPAHKGKEKEGEIYEGHIHLMALRKMIKLFLSHLWAVWRTSEGLPVTQPYAIDKLEHQTYYEPFYDDDKSFDIMMKG